MIDRDDCDRCDPPEPEWSDGPYNEPPLYPAGKLAAMSVDELRREHTRQCGIQGAFGDAEHIDDWAVSEAEARCAAVQAEIKQRKDTAP